MELTGQTAIVTGASHGLGRRIAHAFVRAGASVVLIARGGDALQAVHDELVALGGPAQAVDILARDVSDAATATDAVARAAALPGRFSILVNNAGVTGPIGMLETNALDEWARAVEINLIGTVRMCHAALPGFRAQRYGRVINLSGGGATSPRPAFSAYAAAKAGVVRFTETLAHEVRDAGITVNAVAPGALNTRMLDDVLAAGAERTGADVHEAARQQRASGGASIERAADLIVQLASESSAGITGRLISAAWDPWEQLADRRDELADSDIYTLRRITPEDRGRAW